MDAAIARKYGKYTALVWDHGQDADTLLGGYEGPTTWYTLKSKSILVSSDGTEEYIDSEKLDLVGGYFILMYGSVSVRVIKMIVPISESDLVVSEWFKKEMPKVEEDISSALTDISRTYSPNRIIEITTPSLLDLNCDEKDFSVLLQPGRYIIHPLTVEDNERQQPKKPKKPSKSKTNPETEKPSEEAEDDDIRRGILEQAGIREH